MRKTRLLIADDHPNVSTNLAALLRREVRFDIVGQATTSDEVMERVSLLQPHVLLIDPVMRDGRGMEVLQCIREILPDVVVVVLTAVVDTSLELELRKLGITHIIPKRLGVHQLVELLQTVSPSLH